jgi:hypothetical protein
MRNLLAIAALAVLSACTTSHVPPPLNEGTLPAPTVSGVLKGAERPTYIPFSDYASGNPVIATEDFVKAQVAVAGGGKPLTIYMLTGGEGFDDSRLPDVIWVDGSKDNDITATLNLTSTDYRRFWFVNLSKQHDVHIYQSGTDYYTVGGPMSTSLIVANKAGFYVLSNAPAYVPAPAPVSLNSASMH